MNYDLVFQEGELYPFNICTKVVAKNDKGETLKGSVAGFGFSDNEAVRDFINRNSSEIISKVFDAKESN